MKRQAKKIIVEKHQAHKKDTGSSLVQVALLSARIAELTEHLKVHKKDAHSRRGLYKLVGKRRKTLSYMKSSEAAAYKEALKIKGVKAAA